MLSKPYKIAISPCPNDTYAFYSLLHGQTNWRYPHSVDFLDIEALNLLCFEGDVDFCKVSFNALLHLREDYALLRTGSALGFGCGPLIVARKPLTKAQLKQARIAVPGVHTTAYLLLQLYLGKEIRTAAMPFDQIMAQVASGQVDAGLIIHESRFTYQQHGLQSLVDLGSWWEAETGEAIPLGGIVASRRLNRSEILEFEDALGQSLDDADSQPQDLLAFMSRHAQEMDPEVMRAHVKLYVNTFTRNLGDRGLRAIETLMTRAEGAGLCEPMRQDLLVPR